ncbi:IgGFc-binding protein-like isoform X1 [Mytilus edulis]|uniref:IgGFc-binding protein-like isoform X1 n=1 Tax=Mytilus edulis TaxID=6550 RepID=UPI0039EE1DBC
MYDMLRIGLFLLYGCLLLKNSSALTCFNCPGIRHPRFCEYVKDCLDGQVCGLERQVESNGAVIFSLGCLSQNTCNTNPSTVDGRQKCFHCCSTDLCNIDGCGESGLSMANDKVCYSCLGLLDPNACRSISFCDKSELCYLEEKTHFGEKFYQSGCREKHICEAQLISFPIIGRRDLVHKRSTTHMTCCGHSLCNNEGFGIKKTTTTSSKLSTFDGITTLDITTNLPDICVRNRPCYNGGTCQSFNDSYRCICAAGYLGKQCEYSDGKDTSFMVIFQEGLSDLSTTPKLLVASENTTRLSVRYFNENKIQTITMDKSNTEYNLSKSVLPSDGIHVAGVELHSDEGINVYGFFHGLYVSGGYSSMPTRFASTKYIIPTLPAFFIYKNMIALTPGYQNTVVSINLKLKSGSVTYDNKQYSNNDTIRIMVNKYNTFQLSTSSDLSGTLVTSSKPVIVVSGNKCNYAVPYNTRAGSCNPFIESVLPTNQFDSVFITPYISTRLNNTVRIQVINSTNLTIKTGNKTISKTINARDFFDFYYNTISFISSSDDILVMSYPHGLSGYKGDPFMMTIPGVNQYLYKYDFVVPIGLDSFISITVQSDAINGFLLDGNPSNNRSNVFSISEGLYNFSTFSMPIKTGFHHIEHRQNIRFGLWVYGNRYADGYGYPAGMAYKKFD